MKTYLDCLPCLMRQALMAARAATDDEEVQRQVINAVAGLVPELSLGLKPPEITQCGYRLISQITGNNDPFHQAKVEANRAALALWPKLKQLLEQTADRLFMACRLAILANSIDFGPDFEYGGIEAIIDEARLETYSLPSDSSSFISRGTLTFKIRSAPGKAEKECLMAHIVGSAKGETKVMLDIDEKLFPQEKSSAL